MWVQPPHPLREDMVPSSHTGLHGAPAMIACKPRMSQYPMHPPNSNCPNMFQLSPTSPHPTSTHSPPLHQTPTFPFHPTQTPPILSHPIPPQSILTHSHPISPVDPRERSISRPLNPTPTIVFHSTLFLSIPPPQSIDLSHPNTPQRLLILPQLTPSYLV